MRMERWCEVEMWRQQCDCPSYSFPASDIHSSAQWCVKVVIGFLVRLGLAHSRAVFGVSR